MSRRSRRSGPAITLFFFQDIIMSTSGIMIMIVLLLSLELIARSEMPASVAEAPTDALQQQVVQLDEEIALLEQQILVKTEVIQSAAQMTSSERNEQIQHLQTANNLLKIEMERLQMELTQHNRSQPTQEIRRHELSQLLEKLKALRQAKASIAHSIQNELLDNRPLFSISHGDRREGWLVDISDSKILVAPLGKSEKPLVFTSSRRGFLQSENAADAFLKWSRTNSGNSNTYYFLFVRPNGVDAFETLSKSFRKEGVAFGYDLANSSQKLLDSHRGAGE